jgi:glycogen debranching enzyme
MRTGGIGSIAEIFDADAPHIGRGCFAQAWSIGTLLAAWTRLGLGEPPHRT